MYDNNLNHEQIVIFSVTRSLFKGGITDFWCSLLYTLGQISLLWAVSVCTKTTLIRGSVGGTVEWSHTCTSTCMSTYSNFQINGASGEILFRKLQILL